MRDKVQRTSCRHERVSARRRAQLCAISFSIPSPDSFTTALRIPVALGTSHPLRLDLSILMLLAHPGRSIGK